jgi:multiple sugar transport system substrate-binding protein
MNKKLAVMMLVAVTVTGCSSSGNTADTGKSAESNSTPSPEKQEPVTLTFFLKSSLADVDNYVTRFVAKKFPHVTLEIIKTGKGQTIQDLVVAGNIPDLMWEGLSNIQESTDIDVPMDLSDLIKKYSLDMNQFSPNVVNAVKSYAPKNEILFVPFNEFILATHYNPDIFDKFGVAYPKNNPTWEEIAELGRQLTRTDGTTHYKGLKVSLVNRFTTQMGLSYVDANNKSNFQNDQWRKFFEFYKYVNDVPNQPPIKTYGGGKAEFMNDRTLAIFPDHIQMQNTDMVAMEAAGLKWDMVSYPMFKDKPNFGPSGFSDGFVIPKGSKNVDIAFQLIKYLSTDPEVQLEATKNGRITALKDQNIRKHAFENNPAAKGKNLANVNMNYASAVPAKVTFYDKAGYDIAGKKLVEYAISKKDLNTILREAEEDHNKSINQVNTGMK